MKFFIGLTGTDDQKLAIALEEVSAIKELTETEAHYINNYRNAKTLVLIRRSCTSFPVKESYDEIVKLINRAKD